MKMLFAIVVAAIASVAACTSENGPSSLSETPTVSVLSPGSGPVGTAITLTGSGFAADGNIVRFGTGYIRDVSSPDGRTIRVSVPAALDVCPPTTRPAVACLAPARVVTPGTYAVSVMNGTATSSELPFRVLQE
jgi:IPT/TIG domain-containing protein